MMKELKTFGITGKNNGASTGSKWLKSKGPIIESYSPVDGKLMASVTSATEKEYKQVIATANLKPLKYGQICRPRSGVKLYVGEELRKG